MPSNHSLRVDAHAGVLRIDTGATAGRWRDDGGDDGLAGAPPARPTGDNVRFAMDVW
ncbi:hypothetical protein [Stenotrophomonas rhizophila]|uniref:hypothetical protein n=1 Tax=Stenotrophomonas rhizophila TaxID=216778 RepID=UPI001AEC299F|nr:hypothetical protein [Stenotrophomonas rhizophila]